MKIVKKILLGILIALLAVGILAGAGYGGLALAMNHNAKKHTLEQETFQSGKDADRIHFLSTGSSDAILLESNGHFALIDAGEDSQYPDDKPNLNYTGYEERVVAYLKKVAGDQNGKVTLDFVLGTHAHSDHIGGFDTVINDPDITVKTAYLKPYHAANIRPYEQKWDNQEVYDQMVEALNARKVPIVSEIPQEPFHLGDFTIQFFNTQMDTQQKDIGENDNSVGTKVTKGGKSAFLAGDMDNITGDEDTVGPLVGKVDLLKAGHHGYIQSTSRNFAKTLNPDLVIFTNYMKKSTPDVKLTLTALTKSSIYATVDNNGIVATFTDDETIILSKDSCAGMPEGFVEQKS